MLVIFFNTSKFKSLNLVNFNLVSIVQLIRGAENAGLFIVYYNIYFIMVKKGYG